LGRASESLAAFYLHEHLPYQAPSQDMQCLAVPKDVVLLGGEARMNEKAL
jgi:hypothetical protein